MLSYSSEKLRSIYEENGLISLHRFLRPEILKQIEQDLLTAEDLALTDLAKNWSGQKVVFFTKNPVKSVSAENCEDFVVTPYFQKSKDRVHLFIEEIQNRSVLNRLGHGLHLTNGIKSLQDLIYSNPTLHRVLRQLGYKRPVCLLSVYIPKHPHGFGSEVRPHQESTFAHTQPLSSCVLWVAIDDALIENACMYGLPGSHQLPLKFISRVDHAKKRRDYVQIHDVEIPEFDPEEGVYQPLEVRAGDAILFHGNYVHCSPQNTSAQSRRALSFQFIETEGVEFSRFNWIQGPNSRCLYE